MSLSLAVLAIVIVVVAVAALIALIVHHIAGCVFGKDDDHE